MIWLTNIIIPQQAVTDTISINTDFSNYFSENLSFVRFPVSKQWSMSLNGIFFFYLYHTVSSRPSRFDY